MAAIKFKYAIGYAIDDDPDFNRRYLNHLVDLQPYIYDIHFAHYDSNEIASGRFVAADKRDVVTQFVKDALELGFTPSLLINYLLHDDLESVVQIFDEVYYRIGLRSVVIADLRLAKMMRAKYPDLRIQGSVLSYGLTEGDLNEQRSCGIEIHNPAAEIIRDPEQIKKNHKAGFNQKIMAFEGCMTKCPHEKAENGHRWHIARGLDYNPPTLCDHAVPRNLRLFFRANWTTAKRLDGLRDYIEVIKMPRGTDTTLIPERAFGPDGDRAVELAIAVRRFIDIVENAKDHDVLALNAVSYGSELRRLFRQIPSTLMDDEFLDFTDSCGMRCDELGCIRCHEKARQLEHYLRDPEKYEIRGVSIVRKSYID